MDVIKLNPGQSGKLKIVKTSDSQYAEVRFCDAAEVRFCFKNSSISGQGC